MVRSCFLAACALLALVSTAHAGTASVADGRVRFEAAPGEDNAVRLARVTDGLELSDRAGGLVAGEGCRQVLPRRVVCAGEGLVALCGDGRDRVEDPDRTTFVDASCERVRFYTDGSKTVRNSLTVLAHPVAMTASDATFRIRCPQSSANDFGEYNACEGTMVLSSGGRRLGVRRFSSGRLGASFRVRVPLSGVPDDAVVAGIDFPGFADAGEPDVHARWGLVLGS